MSYDFRLKSIGNKFIYGLTEWAPIAIANAQYVANPGCFATAIQLALLPLAQAGLLHDEVHIHALTGSSGAGFTPSATTHFSWRNNNVSVYKAFSHQHLDEIKQSIQLLQPHFRSSINFIPMRGNFTRGIFSSLYMNTDVGEDELLDLYTDAYQASNFVHLSEASPALKQVINTNKCLIHLQKIDGKIFIQSILDNLLKGASGQAVQNMNLMCQLSENEGLNLKGTCF